MLTPDGEADGFALVTASAHEDWIEGRYLRGEQTVALRLEHPAQSARAGVDTRLFRIVARDEPEELVRAVARRVGAWEHEFRWQALPPPEPRAPALPPAKRTVDVEWLAFQAGIKPALRVSADASRIDEIVARYRELGAHVARSHAPVRCGDRDLWVAYVAHSIHEARELRRVEGQPRHDVELGRLLGTPGCCAEAFDARLRLPHRGSLGNRVLRPPWQLVRGVFDERVRRAGADDWYLAAYDAWVERPLPPLNVLLLSEHRHLLSFDPCRYDCEAALSLATRIADAIARVDAPWLEHLMTELSRPIAITPERHRAHVELEGPLEKGSRIVRAWAPVRPDGGTSPGDEVLRRRLPGRAVSPRGRVEWGRYALPTLVVDFSAGR